MLAGWHAAPGAAEAARPSTCPDPCPRQPWRFQQARQLRVVVRVTPSSSATAENSPTQEDVGLSATRPLGLTTAGTPSSSAATPSEALATSNASVARWFCDTYSIPYRTRVLTKVQSASEALAAAEPASGGAISLEQDVLPKAKMLEALAPGLGWKVFARYPAEFIHPDAVDYWRILAAYLYTSGFSADRIASLFTRHPCLFAHTVRDPGNLKSLFDWLRQLGLGQADVARLINTHPLILQADVEGTLKPRLAYLTDRGLSHETAVAVIRRYGQILSIDPSSLQERVDYLTSLGLDGADVAKVMAAQAPVFTCSVDAKLRPVVALLQEELGCQEELLRLLLVRSGLLSRSPDTIRARVAIWRGLGLSSEELLIALRRFPRLLLYPMDEEKYVRKIRFLKEELGLAPACLAAFPQYVSYSLPQRIAPRVAAVRQLRGVTPRLASLAQRDDAFCRTYGITQEEYAAFVKDWSEGEEAKQWADG